MRTSSASAEARAEVPTRVVVDANPILSAVISERSAAARIFWSGAIAEFATAAFTLGEVREYLPELAEKVGRSQELLELNLRLLPLRVYPEESYREQIEEARRRIAARDPDDVDLLALALHLNAPIWSNDQDFEVSGVAWYPTARLLRLIEGQ